MKKLKKVVIFSLAIAMILGSASIAFADYQSYDGTMQSSFWSKSINKLNDTEVVDNNSFCYRQDSTTKTSYKSSCWEEKTTRITDIHTVYSGGRWWEYDPKESKMVKLT